MLINTATIQPTQTNKQTANVSRFRPPNLPPGELPETPQLKCFPRSSLLRGGRLWKQQRPLKEKPHDDDDDGDDESDSW